MTDPRALKIYIDGSAYRNPGHNGGLAAIAEFPEDSGLENEIIFEEGYENTTNNRMELRACIKAFLYIKDNYKRLHINRVIIFTDSMYVYDNQNRCDYWKKNKWKNMSGKPVENPDLWKEFISLKYKSPVRTEIQWFKGKSTPLVKEVDKRAKKSAKEFVLLVDTGYRSGRVAKTKSAEKGGPTLFPAAGQKLIIRIYIISIRTKDLYKITFEVFDVKTKLHKEKHYAYVNLKEGNKLHRHQYYQVIFNKNPKFPLVIKVRLLKENSSLLK